MNNEFTTEDVINNLLDSSNPFNPQSLHFFSDISLEELEKIKSIWNKIPIERKVKLLKDLETLMEADTLVSCDEFSMFALQDDNPRVKSQAIQLLWECSDIRLASKFIDLLLNDPDSEVNATAAAALGKFVLLGELEEIPSTISEKVQTTLIDSFLTINDDKTKQRVLESIGYSSDERIKDFILEALSDSNKEWHLSALIAMGRSANEIWEKFVVEKLSDPDPDIMNEAIKTAGELEIASAKEYIIEILENSSPDEEVHLQSIWALSKIGGRRIKRLFDDLLEHSDNEEETDMLELAMDNLDLTNGISSFDLYGDEQE